MLFETNKEKGNSGLAIAIGYFGSNGYVVSIPLNDTQDYDLIVDKDNLIERVQVKATSQRSTTGYSIVSLKSSGGTNGSIYKRVADTKIEKVFILTEKMEMYLIPFEEITTYNTLTLTPDRQKFRVDTLPYTYKEEETQKDVEYSCSNCGKKISKNNKNNLCEICYHESRRVVERPAALELAEMISKEGFEAVGRLYKVSGNTIKKWCDYYKIPRLKKEIIDWYQKQLSSAKD